VLALLLLFPLISIIGCAGVFWYQESQMPPVTGHPFRGHLDSAAENWTRDELGWAAATALAHARGEKEPGAEPCEIGERLVTGRLATFEASTAALAALKALDSVEELTEFRILAHDGAPYASQKREVSSSDRWRLDADLGIDGERISFHFSWDTTGHVLTLTEVTTGEVPAVSPSPTR